jgi:hypothetical protein
MFCDSTELLSQAPAPPISSSTHSSLTQLLFCLTTSAFFWRGIPLRACNLRLSHLVYIFTISRLHMIIFFLLHTGSCVKQLKTVFKARKNHAWSFCFTTWLEKDSDLSLVRSRGVDLIRFKLSIYLIKCGKKKGQAAFWQIHKPIVLIC